MAHHNFLVTEAKYADMVRGRFPGETPRQLAARVGHDLGNCVECDFDFLLEVVRILRADI